MGALQLLRCFKPIYPVGHGRALISIKPSGGPLMAQIAPNRPAPALAPGGRTDESDGRFFHAQEPSDLAD